MLREELMLLQEQSSYVGEVIKPMDKKKVLVKVFTSTGFRNFFAFVADFILHWDVSTCQVTVSLLSFDCAFIFKLAWQTDVVTIEVTIEYSLTNVDTNPNKCGE